MKTSNLFAAAVVTTTMVAAPMTAFADFYPASRQTYTCTTPSSCVGADHVTFNSFTNNPVVGDERPFLAGSLNGANVADRVKVKDGDVVTVRMYIHNNADATKMGGEANTIAKNVKAKVLVPTASQNDTNMVGFISADNANPGTINDTMSVYGDSNFTLNYVKGSAQFTHADDGVNQKTVAVSDDIVAGGANLGNIKGCFAYSGYVTIKVKVTMPSTPTPPAKIQVCELATKKIVTITEDQFNTTKYSKDLNKCADLPTPGKLQVCELATKKIVTINEGDFDSAKYSKDLNKCAATPTTPVTPATPTTPTTLVNTGAGQVAGMFAVVAVAAAVAYNWVLRRQNAR